MRSCSRRTSRRPPTPPPSGNARRDAGGRFGFELNSEDFWELPPDFSLAQAVCSYGYFALAPNIWSPAMQDEHEDQGSLVRPLRYGKDSEEVVWAKITQEGRGTKAQRLRVGLERRLNSEDATVVMNGVARMLRVLTDLKEFHELCPAAKKRGFGRTFRSPTLWEDMVKTITNCNMKWSGTVRMNLLLCQKLGKNGAFPVPTEILTKSTDWLKENCKLGYRAERVRRLAASVEGLEGEKRLDLAWLDSRERTRDQAFNRVLEIYGFGNFAAYNVCQLLGFFDSFPYDSETARHFKEKHGVPSSEKLSNIMKRARVHYNKFAPYQFLAYWFELWCGYEARRGSTSTRWRVRGDQKESTALFDVTTPKKGKRGNRASRRAIHSTSAKIKLELSSNPGSTSSSEAPASLEQASLVSAEGKQCNGTVIAHRKPNKRNEIIKKKRQNEEAPRRISRRKRRSVQYFSPAMEG